MSRNDGLVDFGKYNGKAIENLIADERYVRWLLTQEWFINGFGWIHEELECAGYHIEYP